MKKLKNILFDLSLILILIISDILLGCVVLFFLIVLLKLVNE